MPRTRHILIPLAAALAFVPATGAEAQRPQTINFVGTFEAQRTITWDRPRTVAAGDCNGDWWGLSYGSDKMAIKSRGSFKVKVFRVGGSTTWTFGRGHEVADPRDMGIDAAGPHTREWTSRSGTTGGWCRGPVTHPSPKTDCGTQLNEYKVNFYVGRGTVAWGESYRNLPRERQGFYQCRVFTPGSLPQVNFPRLEGRLKMADVLNPRRRTITVKVDKTYGPDTRPIGPGVNETASGAVSWKLVLKRAR